MDNADRAQYQQEQLAAVTRMKLTGATKARQESAYFCRECEEPIPAGRRLAVPGVQLCVECQQEQERRL